MADQMEILKEERNDLGKAIAEAALKAGIYNGEVGLTGPLLIMLCNDMAEQIIKLQAELDRHKSNIDITECALGISGIYARMDERNEALKAALQSIFAAGHNDECIFCGLKDKIAIGAVGKQSESKEEKAKRIQAAIKEAQASIPEPPTQYGRPNGGIT